MADLYRRVSTNSLIASSLLHPQWLHNSNQPLPNAGATSDGYLDGVQLASSIQGGTSYHYFMLPAGVTSFRLTFSGSEATQKPLLLKVQTIGGADVTVYRPGLKTTSTDISWVVAGLTPLTTYRVVFIPNEAGTTAAPVIGPITLQPIGGAGVFAGDFIRVSVDEGLLGPTANNSTTNDGRYVVHESMAEFSMDFPGGGQLTVESWGTNNNPTNVGLLANGRIFQAGQITAADQIYHDSFNVPAGLITIRAGATKLANNVALGNWQRAAYVATNSLARTVDAPPGKTLVILGDSIACGYLAPNACLQGWSSAIRARWPGNVLIDAYGIRTAFDDMQDAAHRTALATRLKRANPAVIVIALGTNDYGGTTGAVWTAANFSTGFDAGLVALNAAMPGVQILVVTPIVRTPNTANTFGAGNALSDYTAAENAACVAHPTYATAINGQGARFPQLADLNVDGTHPNLGGHGKYGEAMIEQLATLGLL